MTTPTKTFDFPQELLLIIKELVAADDLRTHVCFYLSSPRVAALYDTASRADTFWELMCWNNGLSGDVEDPLLPKAYSRYLDDEIAREYPTRPRIERLPSWKDVAIKYIMQDGFCTHPQCGEALLERNRQRMRSVAEHIEPLEPVEIIDYRDKHPPFAAHDIFEHIEYKFLDQDILTEPPPAIMDAHLRPVGGPLRKLGERYEYRSKADDYSGLYLAEHPFVTRSFAVFPPVTSVMLLYLTGQRLPNGTMSRSKGIEVHDVVCAIHEVLDNSITVYDAQDYVNEHHECFPKEWTFDVAFSRMTNTRSMLSICPITCLEYEELTENGPVFSFTQL